jgi:hypothetical protein
MLEMLGLNIYVKEMSNDKSPLCWSSNS